MNILRFEKGMNFLKICFSRFYRRVDRSLGSNVPGTLHKKLSFASFFRIILTAREFYFFVCTPMKSVTICVRKKKIFFYFRSNPTAKWFHPKHFFFFLLHDTISFPIFFVPSLLIHKELKRHPV